MGKRLVVCCDGTWNVPDKVDRGEVCPSNVAKMALAVAPAAPDGRPQLIFYERGVGTGIWDRLRGGAFGWGFSKHVQDTYRFIVDRYEPDDEIYLFGFSRGAYTARSLAGLIRSSGILRQEYAGKLGDAYNLYRRRDDPSRPNGVEARLFRKAFARETPIKFIGVWDTVGALGIPVGVPWLPSTWLHFVNRRWEFHDVQLSKHVEHAYHAVAIDERRPQFAPTLWEQQADAEGQQLEQVWFAGVHTNVGGGYHDSGLSDLAFAWMQEKAAACGLAFDAAYLAENVKPDPFGELRDSKVGLYQAFPDAIRPIGEQVNGREMVHQGAVDRTAQSGRSAYQPPNLLSFLQRGSQVTSSQT